MNVIEKICRALCKNAGIDPDQVGGTWDCGSLPRNAPAWTVFDGDARASLAVALEDMETPSEGMLQAIMVKQATPVGDRLVLTDENRDEVQMVISDYQAMLAQYIKENMVHD